MGTRTGRGIRLPAASTIERTVPMWYTFDKVVISVSVMADNKDEANDKLDEFFDHTVPFGWSVELDMESEPYLGPREDE